MTQPEWNGSAPSGARNLFVYGSLVQPLCLDEVLGHRHTGERLAARLAEFRRMTTPSYAYPFIVAAPGASVEGVLVLDLGPYDLEVLDRYEEVESGVYRRERVEVEAWGCGARPIYVPADTYVAGPVLQASTRANHTATFGFHTCTNATYTPPGLEGAGGMQDKVVYLTPEGKQRFTSELHELVTVRRHEVEEQIRRAKEFADAVDNAEYDEAKQEQAFVEGRIQELERLLASAKVIEEPVTRGDYVRMGSHVKVSDADGEEETYYLVGSHEADPRRGLVSNESPIGRALIGKRVGEEVTVVAPAGSFTLKIVDIN